MKKEPLYLDTSVPSAYYDERVKERKETTIIFWEEILPNYNACISEITTKEINDTKDLITKKKLMKLMKNFKLLKTNKKIIDLSNAYIENGIFPEKYSADAMHVSIATFHKIPYLVSWNFQHLVKVKTRKLVNSVNILKGYKEIEIISPFEL